MEHVSEVGPHIRVRAFDGVVQLEFLVAGEWMKYQMAHERARDLVQAVAQASQEAEDQEDPDGPFWRLVRAYRRGTLEPAGLIDELISLLHDRQRERER